MASDMISIEPTAAPNGYVRAGADQGQVPGVARACILQDCLRWRYAYVRHSGLLAA